MYYGSEKQTSVPHTPRVKNILDDVELATCGVLACCKLFTIHSADNDSHLCHQNRTESAKGKLRSFWNAVILYCPVADIAAQP